VDRKFIELPGAVTRRDFVGGTLLGAGAALLYANAPAVLREARAQTIPLPLTGLGPDWTGPGGIGDYAQSNGNTHEVVNAGHGLRTGAFDTLIRDATDTGETYDLVVVGAGFAGHSAAYTYWKERPDDHILILDNHPIFGGEAKTNEFDVDGTHLWAPQGSTGTVYPPKDAARIGAYHRYQKELGLPESYEWQKLKGTKKDLRVAGDVYGPMHIQWEAADTGFYYENKGWVMNPWSNRFAEAPIPEKLKQDYIWMDLFRTPPDRKDWNEYLDSMTYQDFLTNVVGVSKDVCPYISPVAASMGTGLGCDVISAAQAYEFIMPGAIAYKRLHQMGDPTDYIYLAGLPGGNAGVLRHFLKKLIPGALPGGNSLSEIIYGPVQWAALDRPNQPVRMRLSSLVVDVRHDGSPQSARRVIVTYHKDGGLHRITARHVVMAGHQHLNKRIVKDLPPEYVDAMDQFHHAPMLTLNVALRNWKFMERLGITAARWFEGFGWWLALRRQLIIDGREPMPLDPNKPVVLNMYIPFLHPGLPLAEQCVAARMSLFGMSFKDIEHAILAQLTKMFASSGFDARRDVAGIVANRWGHAYVVAGPGFFYGRNGKPAPSSIIRQRHGRISFGHAELSGAQLMQPAMEEGERAANQVLEIA
jgi:spermidine dehydrogenase